MKHQIRWIALVVMFMVGIAGSLGCATMAVSDYVKRSDSDSYPNPVLTDEIVAIGRPDAVLAKEMGQDNVIAFIGLKNTYLLHKGGTELERISQLKLDGKRMDIDAARSNKLYQKDKQVWGELILTYGDGSAVSTEEISELEKGGFSPTYGVQDNLYQQKINIEGVIYPAIKLPDALNSKLSIHRPFSLYNPGDSKPPMLGKIMHSQLIAAGVAADVVLVPVYAAILGITTVYLVIYSNSQ